MIIVKDLSKTKCLKIWKSERSNDKKKTTMDHVPGINMFSANVDKLEIYYYY